MNEYGDNVGALIALFFIGFGMGASVFAGEMMIFVGNILMDALKPIATTSQATQVISNYSTGIVVLTIGILLVNFLIGYKTPYAFSFGYLFGDFFMICILYTPLSQIAPPVLNGMIYEFLAVLAGIILKGFFSGRKRKVMNYEEYGGL